MPSSPLVMVLTGILSENCRMLCNPARLVVVFSMKLVGEHVHHPRSLLKS